MPRLICAFVVCVWHDTFSHGPVHMQGSTLNLPLFLNTQNLSQAMTKDVNNRYRSACATSQSDQCVCYSQPKFYIVNYWASQRPPFSKDILKSPAFSDWVCSQFCQREAAPLKSHIFKPSSAHQHIYLSWKNLFLPYANNKGADQAAHPRSLISTLVVRCLVYNTSSIYRKNLTPLPSFCGCTGRFESTLVATPEDRFSRDEAHIWLPPRSCTCVWRSLGLQNHEALRLFLLWAGSHQVSFIFAPFKQYIWAASWKKKNDCAQAKMQISLGFCPVWSESLLCAQWVAKDPSFLHVDSEDSDQTGQMPRLIWVFAGHTCHFVNFVLRSPCFFFSAETMRLVK